jgi:hypothetical protein
MRFTRIAICVFWLLALAGQGQGQIPSSFVNLNPLGRAQNGWRLFSVTGSFGYSTLALPANSGVIGSPSVPSFALGQLQSDYDTTASAAFGYNYSAPKSTISLFYSPSYVRRYRFSKIKAFNQTMGINLHRDFAPKWSANLALNGADQTLDQLLFSSAILSTATTPVGTLDDLQQGLGLGQYSGDQLASLLTGSPAIATPSQSVIFGISVLSLAGSAGVSYRPTPRLSISVNGGVSQSQTRGSRGDVANQSNFVIPRAVAQIITGTVSYAWSPRTSVGAQLGSSWMDSSFNRYLTHNVSGFLQRRLTPRLFAGLQAGVGFADSLQKAGQTGAGPLNGAATSTGGVNLGYAAFEQSFTGAYTRSVSDNFGFASQRSESISGSWQWARPGRPWGVGASVGQQRLLGGFIQDFRFWFASASFHRMLSSQLAINFSVGYVDRPPITTASFTTNAIGISGYSTRVTLVWTPGGRFENRPGGSPFPGSQQPGADRRAGDLR